MKRYLLMAIAAAAIAGGCAPENPRPKASGEGVVRAINAIATSPAYTFLNEERFLENVTFKTATSPSTWDGLEYTFNFEVLLTGDTERTRVASVFIDVQDDRDYTLLLTGAVEEPDIIVWEDDVRDWQEAETAFELRVAHASPSLGPVDAYFDLPGTAPVIGARLGTLEFGDILPAVEFESGERSLVLTRVDEPGSVLYESIPVSLIQRSSYIIGPFDADANDVGPVPVMLYNTTQGGTGSIADVNTGSTARFFHASRDMANADIYIDDPLTTPIVSDQAFGGITGDIPVAPGDTPITYTAAGNAGAILIDTDRSFSADSRHSLFAVRNAEGEDVVSNFVMDRRSVETRAGLTLVNTSADNPTVDVYVLRGEDTLEDAFPLLPSLTVLTQPVPVALLPDTYDIYLTAPFEKTVLAGPIPLDAQAGDVIEAVVYDTVDPNVPRLEFVPLP